MKHFLKDTDFKPHEIPEIFALAQELKHKRNRSAAVPLDAQTWALIFAKSSTRTRVSFEVGVRELGGNALFLSQNDIQLGRGESIADTARVLSRYVHGLIVRTFAHSDVEELARHGSVPVVNALTDFLHPCQIYADAFTLAERWSDRSGADHLASLKGRKIAFLGDCACNVANSWILGGNLFGMKVVLAGPTEYAPGGEIRDLLAAEGYADGFEFTEDPMEAARDADVVYTDVWVSMGKEEEMSERIEALSAYAVTPQVFDAARKDAFFMHCLPAYAGREVSREVLDSPRSIIFDQAENRLHVQKAILSLLARPSGENGNAPLR